jgi:hypothetical protein
MIAEAGVARPRSRLAAADRANRGWIASSWCVPPAHAAGYMYSIVGPSRRHLNCHRNHKFKACSWTVQAHPRLLEFGQRGLGRGCEALVTAMLCRERGEPRMRAESRATLHARQPLYIKFGDPMERPPFRFDVLTGMCGCSCGHLNRS